MNVFKDFNLILLSKYRTTLMGIATLRVLLWHCLQYGVELPEPFRWLLVFLNRAIPSVPIFLFLSGIGCYYSLTKPHSYMTWLRKRAIRIFIPYAVVLVIVRLLSLPISHSSWTEWFMYLSTIRFWTHHEGLWFVALLTILYPLAPALFRILESSRHRLTTAIVLMVVILTATHLPHTDEGTLTGNIIHNLQYAGKFTVSFIIGMYLAPFIRREVRVNALYIIGGSAVFLLLFHFFLKDVFYAWLYIMPSVIVLCTCMKWLSESSWIYTSFHWLGIVSLESYVANIEIRTLFKAYLTPWQSSPLFTGHYLDYALVLIIGLILAQLCNRLSSIFIARLPASWTSDLTHHP